MPEWIRQEGKPPGSDELVKDRSGAVTSLRMPEGVTSVPGIDADRYKPPTPPLSGRYRPPAPPLNQSDYAVRPQPAAKDAPNTAPAPTPRNTGGRSEAWDW